jgi:4-amino-4-deoxy-L-arabinose transferase-like glycosyltransferase
MHVGEQTVVVSEPSQVAPPTVPGPSRWRRLWRGQESDPGWVRPSLLALLVGTAVLYLWALGINGMGNDFYAAAVQAGTKSWRAFFFGSLDAASFISVDKPPASLWIMELSGRLFGFGTWSMLVPQVLEGVAAVGLLYAAVRRWYGGAAGLLAGVALALTPVAALMFRFNNPDALLVLLLVAAAYATTRAVESASGAWLALAGVFIGFGFLTKMLQAFLVVPGLAAAYLICAPTSFWRRARDLAVAGLAVVVSARWWVAAVALTPAAYRPFVGGSTNNSILQLAFGYNGLSRITGSSAGVGIGGGGAPGGGGAGFGGPAGITRLFGGTWGGDVAWLIPAALVCLLAGLWLTRRNGRTDGQRAGLLIWGGWLLVTGLVFSFAGGIVHEYYSVALAPAVGALAAIGTVLLWRRRREWFGRIGLGVVLGAAVVTAYVLLDRSPAWNPWLRPVLAGAGLLALAAIVVLGARLGRRGALAAGALAVVAALIGPAAYSVQTVATSHTGAIVSAGPLSAGARFGGGAPPGSDAAAGGGNLPPSGGNSGSPSPGSRGVAGAPEGEGRGRAGAPGGPGVGNRTVSKALTTLLEGNARSYFWVAATTSSTGAAPLELATGDSVMAIGGYLGTDNSITLPAFESLVGAGKVHYFVAGGLGGGGGPGGGSAGATTTAAGKISAWVQANYTPQTVGGQTVYDLTAPASPTTPAP